MGLIDSKWKRISSFEFRRDYTRLTDTTVVTVNNRVIGVWLPAVYTEPVIDEAAVKAVQEPIVPPKPVKLDVDKVLREANAAGR